MNIIESSIVNNNNNFIVK